MLLLWSYFKVVFKDPGSVPENWRAVSAEENLEVGSSWQLRMMDFGQDHLVLVAVASIARMGSCRGAIIVLFVREKKAVRWKYDLRRKKNFEQVYLLSILL
ncbi:uncharacterized protein LOC111313355 isoform X2 [Durio zibethinus]|uniref:Uncharacterized protein LOC111313355 isoform X2 n=1 Tax=Durio zibethinus TaxID=66656 RepID=A0A6P6AYA7_DURZI|nr:uncharacterized protein LOC111313355 isoform X2 [Durio zibethinus]